MLLLIRFAAVSVLMGILVIPVSAHEPGYVIEIPRTIVPPVIDGKLDDAIWKAAESVEWGNIDTGGEVDKDQYSESWAAYDDKFLYIAFKNLEPNTGKLTNASGGHDQDVWRDDEDEVFIETNHSGAGPYFHVMINSENTTQDSEDGGGIGPAWEPDMQSATHVYDDYWALEIKIPFKDLDIEGPPVGETWGWNFNRHIMAGVDIWTGWATTGPSFHTPERFGDLIFGTQKLAVQPADKRFGTWAGVKMFGE